MEDRVAKYYCSFNDRGRVHATVEVSKEALWLKGLVETFSIIQDSFLVHYDSQSTIHLAKDHMHHKWTKHIDVGITRYVSGS